MDLRIIRRLIIVSICADDVLFEKLVLKGGNALDIIYGIGARTSLDVDFSTEGEFEDLEDIKNRLFRSLKDRFDSRGYLVFDEKLKPKPKNPRTDPRWGGYMAEFKIIEKEKSNQLGRSTDALRRQSIAIGDPRSSRIFRIEISKYEFCKGKQEVEVDGFFCYVYTLPMIAVEKLRAICQQMPEYKFNITKTGRARDFYDIYSIITATNIDLSTLENLQLIKNIFSVKNVSLKLLNNISKTRDFHLKDWPAVRDSIIEENKDFDFYFDFITRLVDKLKSFWIE